MAQCEPLRQCWRPPNSPTKSIEAITRTPAVPTDTNQGAPQTGTQPAPAQPAPGQPTPSQPAPAPAPTPASDFPTLDLSAVTLEENGSVNIRVLNVKSGDMLTFASTVPGVAQTAVGGAAPVWTLHGAASMIAADVNQAIVLTRNGQNTDLSLKLHVNGHKVLPPSYPTRTGTAEEHRLMDLVNTVRASGATCGGVAKPAVGPVTWDDSLFGAAFNHSQDQLARNYYAHVYYAHVTPDGVTPGERAFVAGFRPMAGVGENIYSMLHRSSIPASAGVDAAFKGWIESNGHCLNIMDGRFVSFGVASADGPTNPDPTGTETMTPRMWSMELGIRN